MDVPGLIDLNIKERDEQYRAAEGIMQTEDIKKLMDLYHIGKAPLSLALGFGEITVTRYLEGQVPSKHYSDIMRDALYSPEYMEEQLNYNRDKVGETAYRKTQKEIIELKEWLKVSDRMLITIAYIFEQVQEITPLALQKILYFIQGIHLALFDMPIYPDDCYAWAHGPVYEKVYSLFKNFKYNPIDDRQFAVFAGKSKKLTEKEKMIIDLVVNTFGMYSGKTLETITHKESPWVDARESRSDSGPVDAIIPQKDIQSYFKQVAEQYGVDSTEGLTKYIMSKLTTECSSL